MYQIIGSLCEIDIMIDKFVVRYKATCCNLVLGIKGVAYSYYCLLQPGVCLNKAIDPTIYFPDCLTATTTVAKVIFIPR